MSKKGYQKRLPAVLPPSPPAPRRSPQHTERSDLGASTGSTDPAAQVAPPEPATPSDPAEQVEPATPIEPAVQVEAAAPPEPATRGAEADAAQTRASAVRPPPREPSTPRKPGDRLPRPVLVAIVLVNLLAAGFLAFTLLGGWSGPPPEEPITEPRNGPGFADSASYVDSEVLPDGVVVVHHWIRPAQPLARLRLVLPRVRGADGLSATRIEVTADGVRVDGPVSITGRRASYTFDETDDVQVRYRLHGAVERSGSVPGRALARATSLDLKHQHRAEKEIRDVGAPEMLSLACSPTPETSPVPCGRASGDGGWRVELTGDQVTSRVVAQLNLG